MFTFLLGHLSRRRPQPVAMAQDPWGNDNDGNKKNDQPPDLDELFNKLLRRPLDDRDAAPWMGCRPTTADSLPVIDRKDRLLLAFGHQHLGLTQAALTAELITALYHDETPGLDLTPYRLARFG